MADSFYFNTSFEDYLNGKERSISEKRGRYKPRLLSLWLALAQLPRELLKTRPSNIDLLVAVILRKALPFHTAARAETQALFVAERINRKIENKGISDWPFEINRIALHDENLILVFNDNFFLSLSTALRARVSLIDVELVE
jgi:hypothetical protein